MKELILHPNRIGTDNVTQRLVEATRDFHANSTVTKLSHAGLTRDAETPPRIQEINDGTAHIWLISTAERRGNGGADHETFCEFLRLRRRGCGYARGRPDPMTTVLQKQSPLVEDLRNHSAEQLAELRLLLAADAPMRPDPRRPGFFELSGDSQVFYVFRYPTGTKVLLIGVWDRDPVAEIAAFSGTAA